jgi:hypothetical protein
MQIEVNGIREAMSTEYQMQELLSLKVNLALVMIFKTSESGQSMSRLRIEPAPSEYTSEILPLMQFARLSQIIFKNNQIRSSLKKTTTGIQ